MCICGFSISISAITTAENIQAIMRGILVTLFGVTALVSAANINHGNHKDPSDAPAICRAVGSEGFLVAHEYCDKFYKCSHGRPVAIKCPSDLLYDPELERCEWPKFVECGNRKVPVDDDHDSESSKEDDKEDFDNSGHENPSQAPEICARPGSDGALIAHEHCTKFYKCFQSYPVPLKCPPLLHYNTKKQQCDWPNNVDCSNRVIPVEEDNNGSGSGPAEDNDNDADNDHVGGHEDEGHPDPSQAPIICSKQDSESELVAHEYCNYFYICLHGRPFPLICPHGLHFDPKSRECDWPINVECGTRIIPKEHNEPVNEPVQEKIIYDDPSKAPKVCAEHENVLVAHEYCNYFYHCAGGKPVARRCPRGLVYNYYKEECDWPKNVDCGNRVISDAEEDVNEPEDESDKDVAGHDDPSKAPLICAEEESDGVLVAHEICNKFYICAAGVPVANTCPKGLLYKPSKERCEWSEFVSCGDRAPPVEDNEDSDQDNDDKDDEDADNHDEHEGNYDPTKATEICAEKDSDGILIAHEYCNKFYICVDHRPFGMDCPENLFFNPRKNECDWADNVKCWGRIPPGENINVPASVQLGGKNLPQPTPYGHANKARIICSKEESDGILVSHAYCNKFYQCVGHYPAELTCPGILHFSPEEQRCEWPEYVYCGDRIIPEKEEDDGDKDEDVDDEPVGNNFDDPSQAPAICAEENSDGIHVAHEYCDHFYICVHNHPLARECPKDLWYNPRTERCDWKKNVECNGRVKH